jgi:hypothetical protein
LFSDAERLPTKPGEPLNVTDQISIRSAWAV